MSHLPKVAGELERNPITLGALARHNMDHVATCFSILAHDSRYGTLSRPISKKTRIPMQFRPFSFNQWSSKSVGIFDRSPSHTAWAPITKRPVSEAMRAPLGLAGRNRRPLGAHRSKLLGLLGSLRQLPQR